MISQASSKPIEPVLHARQLDAVRLVLVLLPPGADAEHEPAVAHVVDGDRLLGQHGRVAVGVAGDEGSETYPRHRRGEGGKDRPALVHRVVEVAGHGHEVVGHPDAVPSGSFGVEGDIEYLGPCLPGGGPEGEPHVG